MSMTNSLRYCGDVEYKYNRGYGWARIGRYGLPIWVCTGMTIEKYEDANRNAGTNVVFWCEI